jgi:hypothetical protein
MSPCTVTPTRPYVKTPVVPREQRLALQTLTAAIGAVHVCGPTFSAFEDDLLVLKSTLARFVAAIQESEG